jgi:hypothetical protein
MRVLGYLLGADDRPVSGTTVLLLGMGRRNAVNMEEAARRSHYHTVTDSGGRFEFRFDPVVGSSYRGYTPAAALPNLGAYYAVVPPGERSAGAVGTRIVNDFRTHTPSYDARRIAGYLVLRDPVTSITLRLLPGVPLAGRIRDGGGKTLAGVAVKTYMDLHAESHTGYGGENFEHETTTDADGIFRFENLMPGRWTVEAGDTWVRTRIDNGPWTDNRLDTVDLDSKGVMMEIALAAPSAYVIEGVVRLPDGSPAAGAEVRVGISYHSSPTTYSDSRGMSGGRSGPDGRYRVELPTPWYRWVSAEMAGYKPAFHEFGDNAAPLSAGEARTADLDLKPETP